MKTLIAILLSVPTLALATDPPIKHYCQQPPSVKSIDEFKSIDELNAFVTKSDEYRACIQNFIKARNEQAMRHMKAAELAQKEFDANHRSLVGVACAAKPDEPMCK